MQTNKLLKALLGLLGLISSWQAVHAQQPQPAKANEPDTIRLDTKLALLNVGVFDKQGQPVGQLTQPDFTVFENGKPQEIAFFKQEDEPISFGLLLDRSQSMGESNKLEQAKAVALAFLRAGNPRNEAFCIAFNDYVGELSDYTSNYEQIASPLTLLKPEGGTALYDALIAGLDKLQRSRHPRRALIVITDGSDQHSKHTLNELLRRAQQSDVQIYTVGFYSPLEASVYNDDKATVETTAGVSVANPKFIFRALAEETGAETFFPRSAKELEQTIAAIAASLRRQYLLAYYLPDSPSDKSYRQIEVKVRNAALRIKTRRGFLSDEATELDKTKPLGKHAAALLKLDLKNPGELAEAATEPPPLYRETFDQAGTHWPQTATSIIVKGKYRVNDKVVLPALPYQYSDFEATFSVNFLTPPERSRLDSGQIRNPTSDVFSVAGMSFRMNETGYYQLSVSAAPNPEIGMYRLTKVAGGREIVLISWRRDSAIRVASQFKLKCVGEKIEIYANAMKLNEIKDATHRAGKVGLVFNGGTAEFDNLSIKRLDR
ncbi:MAG: VWA domain-containing protein [Acidobacteria bacterium]|nr:VWA domain-containing protein [Acidobacteriota bacterium]